jgi:hypothetical protein
MSFPLSAIQPICSYATIRLFVPSKLFVVIMSEVNRSRPTRHEPREPLSPHLIYMISNFDLDHSSHLRHLNCLLSHVGITPQYHPNLTARRFPHSAFCGESPEEGEGPSWSRKFAPFRFLFSFCANECLFTQLIADERGFFRLSVHGVLNLSRIR